jgi:intein-encoded DNA endonuclease-like protein
MPQLTKKQINNVVREYQNGLTTTNLGLKYNCTRSTIRSYLMKRNCFKHKPNFSQKEIDNIIKLYLQYKSIKKVTEHVKVDPSRLRTLLKKSCNEYPLTNWTKEQENQVKELYTQNKTATEISKLMNIKPTTIIYFLRKINLYKNPGVRKYTCNFNYFETIDTEEKAYWLGFIAADGNINRNVLHIGIQSSDINHLEKFKKSINATNPIVTKSYIDRGKILSLSRIDIVYKKIKTDLIDKNITPNKSKTITWNKISQHMSTPLKKHLLRGYSDGDGCWTTCGKNKQGIPKIKWSAVSGSYKFINELSKWLSIQIGSEIKFYKRKVWENWYINISGQKRCQALYDLMYSDSHIMLDRKRLKAQSLLISYQ